MALLYRPCTWRVRSCNSVQAENSATIPVHRCAVGVSKGLGTASFAPGDEDYRDGALQELLAPRCGRETIPDNCSCRINRFTSDLVGSAEIMSFTQASEQLAR